MVSAHSHVRAALEAALPVLRTSLAENGIQLSQNSVSSESFAGATTVFIPSSTMLHVLANTAVLMKRAMSYCLPLLPCIQLRAVTVP